MYSHPRELLSLYASLAERRLGSSFEFEFSKYIYSPQKISEKRDVFRAAPSKALPVFEKESRNLAVKEDIAFHSRVVGENRTLHIPMVDMGCDHIESHLPEFQKALRDFQIRDFSIFHSGRSFHIYAHALLEDDAELVRFMGRILLLNLPKQERVIDERWVGHRLMALYLTLRWTNNNPHYKSLPKGYLSVKT